MILYPKDWVEPEKPVDVKPNTETIKTAIKNMVKTEPKYYYDIIKTLQLTYTKMTNDELRALIDEVKEELHPTAGEIGK